MAKLTLTRIAGGYSSVTSINANQVLMEAAMEKTLSRDGSTPNAMGADLDMNSNRVTNMANGVANQDAITLSQAGTIVGVTNALTQDNVAAVLWPQSTLETAGGVTATELQFWYGDAMRYGAKIDATTDDTAAFNAAIQSGYSAFCSESGNAAIEGTILLDNISGASGSKTFIGQAGLRLERYTDVDLPMVWIYGLLNTFQGNNMQLAHKTYTYSLGMMLVGPKPANAYTTDDHAVNTKNNIISGVRFIGHQSTIEGDGSPALYVHSAGRKRGNFLGDTTYYNSFQNLTIQQVDIAIELSTDANSNSFVGCSINNFNTAALKLNASYGNQGVCFKIEKGVVVSGSPRRYAIHFGNQNYGIESDTHSDYPIGGAQDNYFSGFAELHNDTGNVVSLMTHEVGNSGAANTYGSNELNFHGTLPAGTGVGGFSTLAGIGPNYVTGDVVFADYVRPWRKGEKEWKNLDDATGQIEFIGGAATIGGRQAAVAESTAIPIFSIDDIGPNNGSVMIKLSYAGKAAAAEFNQAGEIWWIVGLDSDTTYEAVKMFDVSSNMGDGAIFLPAIAVAQGTTGATYMKATVNIDTLAPAGTNLLYYSWKAELISSQLEGTNLDWAADVSLLSL